MTLLLADIGGTHVRFAVEGKAPGALAYTAKYPVARFENFPQAVQFYAAGQGLPAIRDIAIATAAWPDENGVWRFAHDGRWTISEAELRTHGIHLHFIGNDFMASAKGAISAGPESLLPLWRGDGVPANGRKLVIGPGTGLGIACAGENGAIQETFGGHMAAAAVTAEQAEMIAAAHAYKRPGRMAIVEDLVSGPGLDYIYRACCEKAGSAVRAPVADLLGDRQDTALAAALRIFHELLGLSLHFAALYNHAFGGLYLDGGVMHRLQETGRLDAETLRRSFRQNGVPVVDRALSAAPAFLVTDPFIALRGIREIVREGKAF